MSEVDYIQVFQALLPEAILTVTALVVLAMDLAVGKKLSLPRRMLQAGVVTAAGCLLAALATLSWQPHPLPLAPLVEITNRIQHYKVALLALTLGVALLAVETDFTSHVGEYFALLLFATTGFLLLVSANNLLLLFIALELSSLSLYLLTALAKSHPHSAEAGLKYFLYGSMASAFLLFGFSLLYGLTGQIYLHEVANAFPRGPLAVDPAVALALVLVVGGFAFKIAVAPFHLWAPDAYQGAPAPSAALIASGSKAASFLALFGLLFVGLEKVSGNAHWAAFAPGWKPLLALLAALSMVLGNLAALVQKNVRRLLAYSAIAHGGYALLAVLTRSEAALAYYVFTYGLAVVGALGVVSVVERSTGGAQMEHFVGLSRRSPTLAAAWMIFLLSLAGIPPLAGFFGKFYVFLDALHPARLAGGRSAMGLLYLVILAIATSAISLYYYLQVLKHAYRDGPEETPQPSGSLISKWVLAILALAVVWLGCFPNWFLQWLR